MIPEHVMRELQYIEIYTAKKIRNLRVGPYTSPLRGPGFDFDEHQPYRPGDDVRRIDWNVTARLNAPFVRRTHAERELNVMVVIDVTRSMEFGAAHYSKKEVMTFITGSLLFSAISDQINVGFLAFSNRVLMYSPPRRTRASAWSVLEQCWSLAPPAGPTAMVPAIRHLTERLSKMSVVFLVSDFMTDENLFDSKELRTLAAKHDVIGVVVEDPAEMMLPEGRGFISVRDLESGRQVRIGLSPRARGAYADAVRRRREDLIRLFYQVPMDYVFVRSDQKRPAEPLLEVFARRMSQ